MRWFFAALCWTIVAAPAALADGNGARSAREHYQQGTVAFNLGHYAEAISEYEAVYRLKPDPALLYNIAQAYRLWDKPAEALRFYKTFLANAPTTPNRSEVESKIAALEQELQDRKRSATASTETARPRPTPPVVVVEPKSAPPPTTSPQIAIAARHDTTSSAGARMVSHPGRAARIGGLLAIAGGVAVVGAGIGCGVAAQQNADSVAAASRTGAPFMPSAESAGLTEQTLEGVFIAVGAAAAVTGVVLYIVGKRQARHVERASARAFANEGRL